MQQPSPTVQRIPHWWQLPFAMALAKTKLLPTYCHLCNIAQVMSDSTNQTQGQIHWFNRLSYLCKDCHNKIAWQSSEFALEIMNNHQPGVIHGIASSFYQFPYRQVIQDYKNSHQLDKLPLLVHAIRQLEKPPNCHADNSVIVPVPTTTRRLTQRGFDPVTILVNYLSFYWQIPIFTAVRREERQKQQGLDREQRLTNTQNAFIFTQLPSVQNVIVFDDVATTGATLQSLIDSLIIAQKVHRPTQPYNFYARSVAHG